MWCLVFRQTLSRLSPAQMGVTIHSPNKICHHHSMATAKRRPTRSCDREGIYSILSPILGVRVSFKALSRDHVLCLLLEPSCQAASCQANGKSLRGLTPMPNNCAHMEAKAQRGDKLSLRCRNWQWTHHGELEKLWPRPGLDSQIFLVETPTPPSRPEPKAALSPQHQFQAWSVFKEAGKKRKDTALLVLFRFHTYFHSRSRSLPLPEIVKLRRLRCLPIYYPFQFLLSRCRWGTPGGSS